MIRETSFPVNELTHPEALGFISLHFGPALLLQGGTSLVPRPARLFARHGVFNKSRNFVGGTVEAVVHVAPTNACRAISGYLLLTSGRHHRPAPLLLLKGTPSTGSRERSLYNRVTDGHQILTFVTSTSPD